MLLTLTESLHVDAPPVEVWKLLRDTPRLAGLLPRVGSVAALQQPDAETYTAAVTDNVGPFKVSFSLEVRVDQAQEPSLLKAAIRGVDADGHNRLTGSMQITLNPGSPGTQMQFEASIEILGKLATLGAVPIRRKTAQSFAEFARNIQGQFAQSRVANAPDPNSGGSVGL